MAVIEGTAKVRVDGAQAGTELEKLESKARDFRKELVELKKQDVLDNKKIKNVEKSLKEVTKEIKTVKQQTADYNKTLKNISGASLKELETAYRKLRNETRQLDRTTTQYKKNAGNLQRLQTEISKVRKEMRGAGTASKGFSFNLKSIGTQLLGAAGLLSAVDLLVDGVREFIETSEELTDIQQDLKSSLDLTKRELKGMSAEINAISSTFKVDYKATTEAATIATLKFKQPLEEITRLIEEGFTKGSNKTGQFNDIIKETSARMADAGIKADQYFAIVNHAVTSGAYSDKGIQSIAEAAQRLRENTQATEDALKPLGESINLQIKQEIAANNSFKAVQLVSKGLRDLDLSAQEAQTIIADVFGGEGEEAGRDYIETLVDISQNLDNVAVTATENEQATLNLSKSWNRFVAGVSESDGIFAKVWSTFKNLLSGAINGVTLLITKINDWLDSSGKTLKKIPEITKSTRKAYDEVDKSQQRIINSNGDLVDGYGKILKTAAELKKAAIERAKAEKQLNDFIKSANVDLIEDEKQRAIAEVELWDEKEKKKIASSKASKKLRDEALQAQEKLHQQKLLDIEDDYNDKLEKKFNDIGDFLKKQNADLEKDRQEIIDNELEAIADKYDKQIELAQAEADKESELQEEFQQQVLELQIAKDEALKEHKEKREQEHAERIKGIREEYGLVTDEEHMQKELDQLRTFYDDKLLTDEEYEIAKANIIQAYRDKLQDDFKEKEEEKLKLIEDSIQKQKGITSAFSDFFSEAKEQELAAAGDNEEKKKEIMKRYADREFIVTASHIVADTAASVMKALAQLGPIAGPIAASFITATGIAKLAAANEERKRVKGLEGGGEFPVTREQDGKQFRATYGGKKRGFIDKPTVLVGEYGKREFVVSNKSLQVPAIQRAVSAINDYQQAHSPKYFNYGRINKALTAIKGFEEGGTFGGSESGTGNAQMSYEKMYQLLSLLLNEFQGFRSDINTWQSEIEVFVELQKIRDGIDTMDNLETQVRLG